MSRVPTLNEEQCYEAAKRLGSFKLAAAELGKNPSAVVAACRIYSNKTGEPHPIGARSPIPGGATAKRLSRDRVDQMPARLDAMEAILADLVRRADQALDEAVQLRGLLEAFTARQPVLLMPAREAVVPTHRRISDGGVGGRREARG